MMSVICNGLFRELWLDINLLSLIVQINLQLARNIYFNKETKTSEGMVHNGRA